MGGQGQPLPVTRSARVHKSALSVCRLHISSVVLGQERGMLVSAFGDEALSLHRDRWVLFLNTIDLEFGVGSLRSKLLRLF